MSARKYSVPAPRPPLSDFRLVRPDWVKLPPRPIKALWLNQNENIDPEMTAVVQDIISELPPEAIYGYPEARICYERLADFLSVRPDQLLLSAGSDGAIRAVFEAFISPGDVVVHTDPTFAMYYVYSQMYGAQEVIVEYDGSEDGPALTVDRFLQEIIAARPRLVCLPNPDSPTGTVFGPDEMRRIVKTAGDMGAVMLVDEAYYPFYDWTALPWIERYGHLVVTRTFAKSWGLAGMRIGYAAASAEMTRFLHKVRPMYEVGTFGLMIVERILDCGDAMLASVERLAEGKRHFLEEMSALGFAVLSGHGNFSYVAFGERSAAVHAALDGRVLYKKEIGHPSLKGFSRFSSAPKSLIDPIVELIRQAASRNGV